MEDARIIDLYFSRSEEAIGETAAKYGPYCASIAMSILNDPEDAEDGCVSGKESLENEAIRRETLRSIQCFLDTLTPVERAVFVCRYWYLDNSKEIADQCGFSRGKVRTMLRRTRIRLMEHLSKEGLA